MVLRVRYLPILTEYTFYCIVQLYLSHNWDAPHVIQVELVLVTSLIAVSRKIIILDLEKKDSNDLIALGVAALALSVSYLIIRLSNRTAKH
jgi:uncharacterized membrane protein (DUF373 family)